MKRSRTTGKFILFLAAASMASGWSSVQPNIKALTFRVSSDGDSVIFNWDTADPLDSRIVSIRSGKVTVLPDSKTYNDFALSPDGKKIVASVPSGDEYRLVVRSIGSSETTEINRDETRADIFPSFSNDGKFVVYLRPTAEDPSSSSSVYKEFQVREYNLKTNVDRAVSDKLFYEATPPIYSSDDSTIIFTLTEKAASADEPGSTSVIVMKRSTGQFETNSTGINPLFFATAGSVPTEAFMAGYVEGDDEEASDIYKVQLKPFQYAKLTDNRAYIVTMNYAAKAEKLYVLRMLSNGKDAELVSINTTTGAAEQIFGPDFINSLSSAK